MMDIRNAVVAYNFQQFSNDLVRTPERHSHSVRREPGVTYVDEFALNEVMDVNPTIYNQFLKDWSRSYYDPEEHIRALHAYGQPNIPISAINRDLYLQSISEAKNRLRGLPIVRAYDALSELDKVPYKPSSAAGYGYESSKGPRRGTNHMRAIARAKAVLLSVARPRADDDDIEHVIKTMTPDIGYTRTQLTDLTEKLKVRGVWGRAFHYILLEGTSAAPLIDSFINTDTFVHIGKDPISSVPNLLSNISGSCKWLYAIDWRQFDATVSRFEIHTAFDILKDKIIFPNTETEIAYEISRQLFIHKKIAAPDGYIYWSHKGIPSGSYFTSIIGSIINFLRVQYVWRSVTGHGPIQCYTLGDDSISGDNILIKPEQFAEVANAIGWYFNPAKTEYSTIPEGVTFLGRTSQGGLNIRDQKRCLRLLVYPEYPVESGRISAYRARSIADDAGGLSDMLNQVAFKLQRRFGIASESEVPSYFKRYVISL